MTPTPTTTGPGSTSFAVWLATFLPGLAAAITAVVQNGSTEHSAVVGLGGAGLALVSSITKLLHDKGLHVATIQAAGSDIAAQLPQLKADLSKTVSFVETDLPGVKGVIDDVTKRVSALEAKVPDLGAIEATVRSVISDAFQGHVPAAPVAAPVVPPVVPPVA